MISSRSSQTMGDSQAGGDQVWISARLIQLCRKNRVSPTGTARASTAANLNRRSSSGFARLEKG